MRLTRLIGRPARPGTVLPMLGVCLIGLCAFTALAVDLGMLAVSRTQCQNGADVAALVGTRTLNNKDGVAYSNLPAAIDALKSAATSNPHLSATFANAQISKIEVGQYLYNTTSQTFQVSTWTEVTGGGSVSAPSGSWTAMRVTINVEQPTYFMRVFGVSSMPSGARATAVYRPRDIAFVLDMTGSMGYACKFNNAGASMNPDTMVPRIAHYVANQGAIVAPANVTLGTGEVYSRNNYTITTPSGPPIVRNFYFDPTNINAPATLAHPLTTKADGSANLLNAFHRWSPPETPGDANNYVGQTYTWDGYDPTHKGNEPTPKGPVPAPAFFGTMTDGVVPYAGDRWRRRGGVIDKTTADWSAGANRAAIHAANLLGYGTNPPTGITPAFQTNWLDFRDPTWEKYGYDLDIPKYITQRAGGAPLDPDVFKANNGNSDANILVPTEDRFQGYSMGPGYWGKTFFIWPPDPRAPSGAPGAANSVAGDWRLRFFRNKSGGALNPQNDNNSSNGTLLGAWDGVNEALLTNATDGQMLALNGNQVNYPAILAWIKSGPQVLPPNLRAGRVLYYSSIPDDVDTSTATGQAQLDKAFWKNYIDFVLATGNYTSSNNLYGEADSWADAPTTITQSDLGNYQFTAFETAAKRPYMRYTDSPLRPRLHVWFGPLSMVGFLTRATSNNDNWLAGTTYEAQSWQLKAGMNSVLDDVKNNHPNDYAGMVMFAAAHHNGVRVGLGQNFERLKHGLFYPRSLLNAIDGGDVTTEYRPYNTTALGGYQDVEIPNAVGTTDPNTGLAYAYNLLSSSSIAAGQAVGTGNARRGAQKIVVFETDGVPNSQRVLTFNQRGYNSYYTTGASSGVTQGSIAVQTESWEVIQQMVKLTATTATTSSLGADSGLSLPNAPARVYPIAFGDLFDEVLAPDATFRPTAKSFLAKCAEYGGTGEVGATTLPDLQIITGPYQQRIDRLRNCLERIFHGVSVVLIE